MFHLIPSNLMFFASNPDSVHNFEKVVRNVNGVTSFPKEHDESWAELC